MAEHALVADPQRLEGGADHVSASRAIIARMTAASCRSFGRSAASFMRRIARRGGEEQVSVTALQSNASPSGTPSV